MWDRQNLEAELASAEANRDLQRRVVNQYAPIPRCNLTEKELWQEHLARLHALLWDMRAEEIKEGLKELEGIL